MNHHLLIKPNADLQAHLAQNPHISMPPELIYVEEQGQPLLRFSDGIESRKLFYMARLYEHIQHLGHSEKLRGLMTEEEQQREYQFYHDLLGNPPYTRRHFDRWWTIERIALHINYKERFESLPIEALEALEEPDSERLRSWIMQEIRWKKEDLERKTEE